MANKTIRTPKRRAAFLKALRHGASIYEAALHIGVSKNAMYAWRADDPEFHAEWDEAVEQITDAMEARLYRDGMNGNTIAQIFWLKSHRPEVYNRRPAILPVAIPGQVITQQGETVIPPLGAPAEAEVTNNVMFALPPNHRDEPAQIEHQKPNGEDKAA
jgi:hypothetical protein